MNGHTKSQIPYRHAVEALLPGQVLELLGNNVDGMLVAAIRELAKQLQLGAQELVLATACIGVLTICFLAESAK